MLSVHCCADPPSSARDRSSDQSQSGPLDPRLDGSVRWREFFKSVTYLDLVRLIEHEELVKELQISDENVKRLNEFRQLHRQNRQLALNSKEKKGPSDGFAAMKIANDQAKLLLKEVLSPERFDRLIGLYAQLHGYSSIVRHEEVAKRIGIPEVDLAILQQKQEARADVAFEDIRELLRMGAGRDEIAAEFKEMRDALRELVEQALTPEQKKSFEKLQGQKFEFPQVVLDESRGSFRRRPPGKEGDKHHRPAERHKGPPRPGK